MHTQALARQVQQNTATIEELQNLMAELLRAQIRTERNLQQLQQVVHELEKEMRDFKNEMLAFKDEMQAFKEEEQRAREEAERERREMNRRWGELANKMGTLAEDLVAPNIPRVLRDLLGCPSERIQFSGVRIRKRHASQSHRVKEFDVVVICDDYVLINETKSSLNPRDVDDFVATLEGIRDFFPEHREKKFIGAIATLYMPPEVAKYAERKGLLALGFGEENMDLLNTPGFTPKLF